MERLSFPTTDSWIWTKPRVRLLDFRARGLPSLLRNLQVRNLLSLKIVFEGKSMRKRDDFDKNIMSEDEIDENLEDSFPPAIRRPGILARITERANRVMKTAEMKSGNLSSEKELPRKEVGAAS